MAELGAGGDNCCAAVTRASVAGDGGTRCKCPDGRPTAVVAVD